MIFISSIYQYYKIKNNTIRNTIKKNENIF